MAKTIIQTKTISDADPSLIVKCATLVSITNNGQSRAVIDNNKVLEPGEQFNEGTDVRAPLNHKYEIEFKALSSPPLVDEPAVYAGNRLSVRMHLIID
ncbi:MAG: hypothetical protein AAF705_10680 [Bacteroidota bacterium]